MPLLFVTYPLPENFFQLHRLPLRASDTQVQDSLYARTVRPTTTLLPFLPPKSPQVHSRRRVSPLALPILLNCCNLYLSRHFPPNCIPCL